MRRRASSSRDDTTTPSELLPLRQTPRHYITHTGSIAPGNMASRSVSALKFVGCISLGIYTVCMLDPTASCTCNYPSPFSKLTTSGTVLLPKHTHSPHAIDPPIRIQRLQSLQQSHQRIRSAPALPRRTLQRLLPPRLPLLPQKPTTSLHAMDDACCRLLGLHRIPLSALRCEVKVHFESSQA